MPPFSFFLQSAQRLHVIRATQSERNEGMITIRVGVRSRIVTLSEAKSLLNPRRRWPGARCLGPAQTERDSPNQQKTRLPVILGVYSILV